MNTLTKMGRDLGDWLLRILRWIGFIFIYLVDSLILDLATTHASQPNLANRLVGAMLIYSALLLAFLAWRYNKQLRANNPRGFGRTKLTSQRFWQLMGFFVLMMAIQRLWIVLTSLHILSSPANQTAINQQVMQFPFWNLAYAILFAPFVEEMIFRGIFLNYFFSKNTRLMNFLGVLVSGLIFGFMHANNISFTLLMYSALGWVLGIAYLHFKDVRYSTALHFLNNLMSLI